MPLDDLPLIGYEFIADQFKKLNKDKILELEKPRKREKLDTLDAMRP